MLARIAVYSRCFLRYEIERHGEYEVHWNREDGADSALHACIVVAPLFHLGFDFAVGPYREHLRVVHQLSSGLGTWSIRK